MYVKVFDQKSNGLVLGLPSQCFEHIGKPNVSGFLQIYHSKTQLTVGDDYSFTPCDREVHGYFVRGILNEK